MRDMRILREQKESERREIEKKKKRKKKKSTLFKRRNHLLVLGHVTNAISEWFVKHCEVLHSNSEGLFNCSSTLPVATAFWFVLQCASLKCKFTQTNEHCAPTVTLLSFSPCSCSFTFCNRGTRHFVNIPVVDSSFRWNIKLIDPKDERLLTFHARSIVTFIRREVDRQS